MDWYNLYISVLKNYVGFEGRAQRKEYWVFTLINAIIIVLLSLLGSMADILAIFYMLYSLATLLPSIAVGVRRLHDTNRSGWWMLLSLIPIANLVLIVFLAQAGTDGENRFGPVPLAIQSE